MATVIISGGTGMVGKALSKLLTAKGFKVIVLSRQLPSSEKQANSNISFAKWDVKKQEMDITALQQADYIIHLAGAGVMDKKWTAEYKKEIVSSRVESAALIVNSLKNNGNKVKAVISASAIGWYKPGENIHTEEEAADENFLGNTCKLWEESMEPVTQLNKRLVKLRIGIVLSKEGGALKEFIAPIKLGVAAILGNGKQMISWIHINDLCRMFLFAIENEQLNGVYNAVAPVPVNNKTLTITLAKKMKRLFYIPVHVPVFVLKLMLGGRSIEILKSAVVSCKKILTTGFDFKFKTIEKALEDIVKH
ncbi:TIGR01777 family oxidoreductase [Ferruginibacter sp.]|nr:TIGR01777 family protein [Ferruginibacter sp.]